MGSRQKGVGTWETGLARCRTSFSDKALYVTVKTPSLRCTQTRNSNARNPRSQVEEQLGAGVSRDPTPSQAISGRERQDSRDPEMNELSEPGSIPRVRGRRKSPSGVDRQPTEGSGEGSEVTG